MSSFTSMIRLPKCLMIVLVAAVMFCTARPVSALSEGGQGGTWPKNWPQELESLRKQAWTWQHGLAGITTSYEIGFTNREEFEKAWPHILKLNSKGTPITLLRGPHVLVKKGKTAGVSIRPPRKNAEEGGAFSTTRITLVVDGNIVDLNRIRLPADTTIIDRRFPEKKNK